MFKKFTITALAMLLFAGFAYAQPGEAAPTPDRSAGKVISLFSAPYDRVVVDTWSASWDEADYEQIELNDDSVKVYTNLNFAGIEFTTQTIDVTGMTHFHMDVWTADNLTAPAVFKIKLVDFGADGAFAGGDDTEHEISLNNESTPSMTASSWNSLDVPLSDFVNMTGREHVAQLIISGDPNTVYVDNVYFFNNSDYPEQLDVHFTVNMAQQVNLENFDPAEDFVWVRGNFNDWGTADQMQAAYTNEVDTILYEYTWTTTAPDTVATGTIGSNFVYKFYHNGNDAENYENDPNRELAWDTESSTLEAEEDWFNRTEYVEVQNTSIRFGVDMFVQIAAGNFDPEDTDQWVGVPGGFNGWTTDANKLTEFDDGNQQTRLYTTVITANFTIGASSAYKFFIKGPEGVDNWESPASTGGGDRTFTVTGEETDQTGDEIPDLILADVYFNDETADDIFLSPATITINVDMNDAKSGVTQDAPRDFDAATDSVYVAGPWNSWLNPGGDGGQDWTPLADYKMADDDGNLIYSWSDEFPIGTSRNFKYKFGYIGPGITNLDNETDGGVDPIQRLDGNGPHEINAVFGALSNIEDVSGATVPEEFVLEQNYPNPFNPTTTIRFTVANPTELSLVIYNSLGQKVKTLYQGQVNAGVKQITWDATNESGLRVASGMYFYQLRSAELIQTRRMILIK
jgi:hypothetical protein